MGVLNTLTNGGLAALSILAVAAFLQAAWTVWFGPRWEKTLSGTLLPGMHSLRSAEHVRRYLQAVEQDLIRRSSPPAGSLLAAARMLVEDGFDWQVIQSQLLRYVHQLDRGAQRWIAFLVKSAPLLGLAGTLVGVSEGLASYAADQSSTTRIIESFAFAISTTLWGVAIAVLGMCTSRLMWQPYLEGVYITAEQQATDVLRSRTTQIYERNSDAPVRSRRVGGRRRRSHEPDRPDGDAGGVAHVTAPHPAGETDAVVKPPRKPVPVR